jgi:cbb3-type cytochrome oxidase maturation protein
MTALAWLIPCALLLGLLGLAAFLWSLNSGQFEDLEGAAWRALQDDDGPRPLARIGANAMIEPATKGDGICETPS